jgi:hypothetical protein
MGQTSNIVTLRKQPKNYILATPEVKLFLHGLKFLTVFERSLNKKGFVILTKHLNFETNIIYLQFNVFYKTKKLADYKYNKIKFFTKKLESKKNVNLQKLLINNFSLFKNSVFVLKIYNMNKHLETKNLKSLYFNFKRFINVLFLRRFNLFIDFLKITSLFINAKVDVKVYLHFLGQIFRLLQKKSHTRFIFFLKFLFSKFLNNKINCLKGVKFIINGKIQGKLRASSTRVLVGSVPIQTITANIEFNKVHVYTRYGAFGFKMWVHR